MHGHHAASATVALSVNVQIQKCMYATACILTEGLGNLQVCGDGHGQLGDGVVPRCCAHLEVNFIASYSCHVILYMINLYGQIFD